MADVESRARRWLKELGRRKVTRVAVGYLIVAWVSIQVADVTFDPIGLPPWTVTLVIWLAILGFPLACAMAWAFDITAKGIERTAVDNTATAPPSAPPAASVAILPFTDMSQARDQEYFCDGIAEEIINALCCVRGLRIASRTSSFQFKARAADVREIGRQLGVGAVLEGSVRKAGNKVRITAQLLNAADGYHLWSQSYDRELNDVFAIQSDIAQRMVDALRVSLTPQEIALIERGGTRSAQAYDAFLRGQQLLRTYSDTAEASDLFRRAIEHDPLFAQAHAGLASSIAIRAISGIRIPPEELEEASAASRRALELEPWMPEAFMARGCLASLQEDAQQAERYFDESIRLNPSAYYTYYVYARHCIALRQLEKAAGLLRTAADLVPEEYTPLGMLAMVYQQMGDKNEQLRVSGEALDLLERHLQKEPNDEAALGRAAVLAAHLGQESRAINFAERALRVRPDGYVNNYNAACAYAILGRPDRALELLELAAKTNPGPTNWVANDDDLASLRGEPRFEAIVNQDRK